MKLTRTQLSKNKSFIDKVALEIYKDYISRRPVESFKQAVSLASVSYEQALALLAVRENELVSLAEKVRLIKNSDD